MASNVPKKGARNGSQPNPFHQDGTNSINMTAQNNMYQQVNALVGALNSGVMSSGNSSSRSQESALNTAVLSQLLSLSASLDPSSSRSVQAPAAQETSDGSTPYSLLLNPQFISIVSALLQKMEPSSVQNTSSGAQPLNSSMLATLPPGVDAQNQVPALAISTAFDATQSPRTDDITDPNVLKLQKLFAALSAATVGQSHLNSTTATFPNQLAIMQWLTTAIQQQAQINRANHPSLPSIPSSQSSITTTTAPVVKIAPSEVDNTSTKSSTWLSSSSGDTIYTEPYVTPDGRVLLQVSNVPPSGGISPLPSAKARHQTNGHAIGVEGIASSGINAHSSKASSSLTPQPLLSQMQTWTLAQLEKHVNLLSESNQPIPQVVSNLLIDFRRKEEKRNAKRVANRKSACTSRARKKALVEEMSRTNERLKRQALILSLLPDLVISITVDGEITFCSDQVERVLHHKVTDLCGGNIHDIIVPASRDALHRLIKNLAAAAEQAEASSGSGCSDQEASGGGGGSETAAIVSEVSSGSLVSFPLSEVNVKNYNRQLQLENQNRVSVSSSDLSHHKVSTVTGDHSVSRSATQSSFGNQSNDYSSPHEEPDSKSDAVYRKSSDDESDSKRCSVDNSCDKESTIPESSDKSGSTANDQCEALSNRGDDSCSSLSVDNGKEQKKAFESIECAEQKKCESSGQRSTSKNFEERSSTSSSEISVDEKRIKSGSEDSGYRESAESENSESDGSNSNEMALKSRPLAPTCNLCLIREDLSTLWCEVTSSIHTTSFLDEQSTITSGKKEYVNAKDQESEAHFISRKELLLCLRPIRDGTEKVSEELKFRPRVNAKMEELDQYPIEADMGSESMGYLNDVPDSKVSQNDKNVSQKRRNSGIDGGSSRKRSATLNCLSNDTEKTVAESLMLMSYFQ